jgi:hypothetical protein
LELPKATTFLKKLLLKSGSTEKIKRTLGNINYAEIGERVEQFDVEETYLTSAQLDAEEKVTRRVI